MILFIIQRDALQHYNDDAIENQNKQKDVKKFTCRSMGPVDYFMDLVFPAFLDFQSLVF